MIVNGMDLGESLIFNLLTRRRYLCIGALKIAAVQERRDIRSAHVEGRNFWAEISMELRRNSAMSSRYISFQYTCYLLEILR